MQWEKPNPTTLSNVAYTINSTYQSAHSTASICATKTTHGCYWHTGIERNLFPTLSRWSLPKIIQNHFINYFYCGQLQTENHHDQKTDWTWCCWTLSMDWVHWVSRKGTAALQKKDHTGMGLPLKEWLSKPVAPLLVSTTWSSMETHKLKQKFVMLVRKKKINDDISCRAYES